jgi:DnaK suppressor protein
MEIQAIFRAYCVFSFSAASHNVPHNDFYSAMRSATSSMQKHEFPVMQVKLQAQQAELVRSLNQLTQQVRIPAHEYGKDEGDRARSSHEKELLSRQASQLRSRLKLIERALGKVRDGSYGLCSNCGEGINPKRLNAIPWTSYCVTCQELIERRQ